MSTNMVFTLGLRHTFACLPTLAGIGTIFGSPGIVRFVQGGVVKTFRCPHKALMDEDTLLHIAARYGISQSTVLGCRSVHARGDMIGPHMRALVDSGTLTCLHTRFLLMSAFNLTIGRVQIVRLWCDGQIDDAALEEHLFGEPETDTIQQAD